MPRVPAPPPGRASWVSALLNKLVKPQRDAQLEWSSPATDLRPPPPVAPVDLMIPVGPPPRPMPRDLVAGAGGGVATDSTTRRTVFAQTHPTDSFGGIGEAIFVPPPSKQWLVEAVFPPLGLVATNVQYIAGKLSQSDAANLLPPFPSGAPEDTFTTKASFMQWWALIVTAESSPSATYPVGYVHPADVGTPTPLLVEGDQCFGVNLAEVFGAFDNVTVRAQVLEF